MRRDWEGTGTGEVRAGGTTTSPYAAQKIAARDGKNRIVPSDQMVVFITTQPARQLRMSIKISDSLRTYLHQ